jgi:trigger factor
MKATWEKIEKNIGLLEVEVDAEQVSLALDKAFKKVAGKVNVPGFRKGKVPRSIFEAKFGIESLYRDAIDIILPEAYMEAVKETGIDPIDRPDIDFDDFSKGNTFTFKAKVMVKPEVQLGDYKGIEVPEQSAVVTAEEINSELESQQKRRAELIVVEDGVAENGDITIIDYEGSVDGVLFDGGKADNHSLELGSNSFIPGFEEQVIGMSKEDVKDIQVTFPEEYHSEDLAGKQAVFKVTLHEIKRKQLPELDDEFAKDVSEYETLEEYKQDIENKLKERKLKDNEITVESTVIEKAALAAEVEIPSVMVDTEVDRMVEEFGNRLRMQGMNMDMYFQFSGQNEDALREQMRDEAEKRVRSQLVLEAIANAENVTVSDDDVNEELSRLSEVYKKPADELRSIIESNGTINDFKQDLITKKTVKLLVESSKLVTAVA